MATGVASQIEASTEIKSGNGRSHEDNWRDTRTSAQCLSYLCLSEHLSDISFTFSADKRIKLPAHKFVLSMRSTVFEAMFYGSLSEGGQTVTIEDIQPEVMKIVLQYMYSDKSSLDGNNVLSCLYTANKHNLAGLVQRCSDYLENSIDESNVCSIHEQAVFYEMKPLQEKCLSFIFENAPRVLSSPDFSKLSHATLLHILKQDELASDEVGIFQAAIRWAENNKKSNVGQSLRDQLGEALFQIRFPRMSIEEFAHAVTPLGILTDKESLVLYQYNATKRSTSTGQFLKQERAGKPIEVDLGKCCRRRKGTFVGCFLEIQITDDSAETRKKSIRLKSISGTFVDNVKQIKINGTRTTSYQIDSNKITFNDSIDNSNTVRIEFLSDDDSDSDSDSYPIKNTHNPKYIDNIKGHTITITRIPDGLNQSPLFEISKVITFVSWYLIN